MRLSVFLFAAATTPLSTTNTVEGIVATPNIDATQSNIMGTRSLRIREAVDDDLDDGSDDEERVGWADIAKLTRSTSLKTLLAQVDELEAKVQKLSASNSVLFKQIEAKVKNPSELREKLGISEKLKKMTPAQLDHDMNYHLWMEYAQWWKTTYGKDLAF